MISLRKSINELDGLNECKRTAVDCYSLAIGTVEEQAIEIDAAQAEEFRLKLESLREEVTQNTTAEQLRSVQEDFSVELRSYREKAQQGIQRLRNDVRAASQAVEAFAGNFAASETDLDVGLKRDLQRMDKAARTAGLEELRSVVSVACASIASSFERVRSSNQLAIAQLKDEIRVLHQEIETARKSKPTGRPSPPTAAQHEIFVQIDTIRQRKVPFSVILVGVKNLPGLQSCYSKVAIENTLNSMHARLKDALPGGSASSRWAETQFAAVVTMEPAAAMAKSRELAKQLSGSYIVQDGTFQTVTLEANAGVLDCKAQVDLSALRRRLEQLSEALAA